MEKYTAGFQGEVSSQIEGIIGGKFRSVEFRPRNMARQSMNPEGKQGVGLRW
jgi:hypothetical protein